MSLGSKLSKCIASFFQNKVKYWKFHHLLAYQELYYYRLEFGCLS